MSESGAEGRSAHAGTIMMVLVGLSLVLIGGLFIWLMGRSYLRAKEMRDWPVTECVILESSIEERQHDAYSPMEFSHQVVFGYEWEGEALTSDLISLRGRKWSSKRPAVAQSHEAYPPGSRHQCHVDPANPGQAVLEMDSLAPLYSIWFPALFVVGGVGILVTSFRSQKDT